MGAKRELIEPHKGDKRYVHRDESGRFTEMVDVGRSFAQERRQTAGTTRRVARATAATGGSDLQRNHRQHDVRRMVDIVQHGLVRLAQLR